MHYASTAPAASLGDAAIVDIAQLLAQTTPAARKARSRRRQPILKLRPGPSRNRCVA